MQKIKPVQITFSKSHPHKEQYNNGSFIQFSDSPDGQPDTDKPVNNKEAFCSVVRGRLEEHSLGK